MDGQERRKRPAEPQLEQHLLDHLEAAAAAREAHLRRNLYEQSGDYGGKSPYRGVFWDGINVRYRAQIGYKRSKVFLGYFSNATEAARAYDRKAVELLGASAKTNFPISDYLAPTEEQCGQHSGPHTYHQQQEQQQQHQQQQWQQHQEQQQQQHWQQQQHHEQQLQLQQLARQQKVPRAHYPARQYEPAAAASCSGAGANDDTDDASSNPSCRHAAAPAPAAAQPDMQEQVAECDLQHMAHHRHNHGRQLQQHQQQQIWAAAGSQQLGHHGEVRLQRFAAPAAAQQQWGPMQDSAVGDVINCHSNDHIRQRQVLTSRQPAGVCTSPAGCDMRPWPQPVQPAATAASADWQQHGLTPSTAAVGDAAAHQRQLQYQQLKRLQAAAGMGQQMEQNTRSSCTRQQQQRRSAAGANQLPAELARDPAADMLASMHASTAVGAAGYTAQGPTQQAAMAPDTGAGTQLDAAVPPFVGSRGEGSGTSSRAAGAWQQLQGKSVQQQQQQQQQQQAASAAQRFRAWRQPQQQQAAAGVADQGSGRVPLHHALKQQRRAVICALLAAELEERRQQQVDMQQQQQVLQASQQQQQQQQRQQQQQWWQLQAGAYSSSGSRPVHHHHHQQQRHHQHVLAAMPSQGLELGPSQPAANSAAAAGLCRVGTVAADVTTDAGRRGYEPASGNSPAEVGATCLGDSLGNSWQPPAGVEPQPWQLHEADPAATPPAAATMDQTIITAACVDAVAAAAVGYSSSWTGRPATPAPMPCQPGGMVALGEGGCTEEAGGALQMTWPTGASVCSNHHHHQVPAAPAAVGMAGCSEQQKHQRSGHLQHHQAQQHQLLLPVSAAAASAGEADGAAGGCLPASTSFCLEQPPARQQVQVLPPVLLQQEDLLPITALDVWPLD